MADRTASLTPPDPTNVAPEAPSPEEPLVETIGLGLGEDDNDDPHTRRRQRIRCVELLGTLTLRGPRYERLRENVLFLTGDSGEALAGELTQTVDASCAGLANPSGIDRSIFRLDPDLESELRAALTHVREGRALGACEALSDQTQHAEGHVSLSTLASALVEVCYLLPASDGSLRERPGLAWRQVLEFLHANDFPVIMFPTEKLAHCVSPMEFHLVAADLAAEKEHARRGAARYFIEVTRSQAGNACAYVYVGSRPSELTENIVWALEGTSPIPERFRRSTVTDASYVEPYACIGLTRADFRESYRELTTTGLPPKLWAGAEVMTPSAVLAGRWDEPSDSATGGLPGSAAP